MSGSNQLTYLDLFLCPVPPISSVPGSVCTRARVYVCVCVGVSGRPRGSPGETTGVGRTTSTIREERRRGSTLVPEYTQASLSPVSTSWFGGHTVGSGTETSDKQGPGGLGFGSIRGTLSGVPGNRDRVLRRTGVVLVWTHSTRLNGSPVDVKSGTHRRTARTEGTTVDGDDGTPKGKRRWWDLESPPVPRLVV